MIQNRIFILTVIFLITSMAPLSAIPDPEISGFLRDSEVHFVIHHDTYDSIPIRFLETYTKEDPDILVFGLHGAVSNAMRYKDIMTDTALLNKNVRFISLDRPGYGMSNPGKALTDIEKQAEVVDYVISKYPFKTCILVGHSYGSAIVATWASKNQDKNIQLVMLAPAIDPSLERVFPTSRMVNNPATRLIMPESSQVAALENLHHEEELKEILPIWQTFKIPVYHIHGKYDMVISPRNLQFSKRNINPEFLTTMLLPDIGHKIITFKAEEVTQLIINIIDGKI